MPAQTKHNKHSIQPPVAYRTKCNAPKTSAPQLSAVHHSAAQVRAREVSAAPLHTRQRLADGC